jgi:EAL and modified HD-GYP domain-containing signal transduction protein
MTVEVLAAARPGNAEHRSEVFLSRQPVVDRDQRVTGYRVAYATPDREAARGTQSSIRLFGDVLSVVGLNELVGSNLAHLPVSRELLLTLGVPPVRPDCVMLRVAHGTAIDPAIEPILDGLAGRGYALSLYDLPGPHFDPALLDLFGTVEVDLSSWSDEDTRAAVKAIRRGLARPLAAGLLDRNEFARGRELGFELFAGPFFASPRVTRVRNVPIGAMQTLASLARLHGGSADIDELEHVIDRDLGLSVRLLRYINSAYFGVRRNITSIRQAVMMLGSRGVSRWALLVALTGGPSIPVELSVMALTRARMCELLAAGRADVAQDQLFTIGLLSLADALLDLPLELVVHQLPLADEVAGALLRREGIAGSILDATLSYERGEFAVPSVQGHRELAAAAYREALGWAQATVAQAA